MWYVVCGMWYVVRGMWYVVCGMWYVVCGMWYPPEVYLDSVRSVSFTLTQ
jgi:hypothetical protein